MNKKKIKSKISKGLKATKKEIKRLLNLIKKTPSDKRNKTRKEKIKKLKKIETLYNKAKTARDPLKALAKIQTIKKSQISKPVKPVKTVIPPISDSEVDIKDFFKQLINGKDPLNKGLREAFRLAGIDINNINELKDLQTLLSGYAWEDLISYIEKFENDFIYEIFYENRLEMIGSGTINPDRLKNRLLRIVQDMLALRTDNLIDPDKLRTQDDKRTDEQILADYKELLADIRRARHANETYEFTEGIKYGSTRG